MSTREVVEALYAAFLAGDGEGMIALMADDVEVTFLGQGTFHGIPAVRRFMAFSAACCTTSTSASRRVIIDGDVGCRDLGGDGRPRATANRGRTTAST